MLEVKGFQGLRFSTQRIGALDAVLAPPYDVITPGQRRELARRSRYSVVHLTLPQSEAGVTPYQAASRHLDQFIEEGALQQDESDSFYLLEQTFRDAAGAEHTRQAFLGVARLPEPGERSILGHERTFPRTVDDRLRLVEATRANVGPVFLLYEDPEHALASFLAQGRGRTPDATAHTLDGVTQRLWRVPHDGAVTDFFQGKRLYIADGHHRFRRACVYRDQMRRLERPHGSRLYDYVLVGLVSISDPGLFVYPVHRLMSAPRGFQTGSFLASLAEWFEVRAVEDGLDQAVAAEPGCAIGVATQGDGHYLLKLKEVDRLQMLGGDHGAAWRDLDVAVLHRGILDNVLCLERAVEFTYEKEASQALAAVERGEHGMAFLLKAALPEQILACAEAGDSMPHKSTYFFPKLPSGAAIYRLI